MNSAVFSYMQEIYLYYSAHQKMLNYWCFHWHFLLRQVVLCCCSIWESWLVYQPLMLLLILLISLFMFPKSKYLTENTFGSLKKKFICKILGWFLYFWIAYSAGSVSSIISVSYHLFKFLILWRYWKIH